MEFASAILCHHTLRTSYTQPPNMDNNTTRSSRRRKKVAPKAETPVVEVQESLEVVITEETPVVEPPKPVETPKLVKPWEIVRPMPPTDGNTWQRGQKWRP